MPGQFFVSPRGQFRMSVDKPHASLRRAVIVWRSELPCCIAFALKRPN